MNQDNEDGSITAVAVDSGNAYTCTQAGEGNDFTCAPVTISEIPVEGLDAVFSLVVSLQGVVTSNTSYTNNITLSLECEGADCEAAAEAQGWTIGCATTGSTVGTYYGETVPEETDPTE